MQIESVMVSGEQSDLDVLDWGQLDCEVRGCDADLHGLEPPFDPWAVGSADPINRVVADLQRVDAAMARVLRAIEEATPRDGLSVRRQVSLLAGATGVDVGFLERAVQTLSAMPRTWASFDAGWISWSQLRGIVTEARRLTVAQRTALDDALAGALVEVRERGEPDRLVEVCGELAAVIDGEQEKLEAAPGAHAAAVHTAVVRWMV